MISALPVVQLQVNGVHCDALVDTGCTKSIAHISVCQKWNKRKVSVTTVSGQQHWCEGTGQVNVALQSGHTATVDVLVVTQRPLGLPFILGMNGVDAMNGVTVSSSRSVRFGAELAERPEQAACSAAVVSADETDFTVTYDAVKKKWSVLWKWSDGEEPKQLQNKAEEYRIPPSARQEYEEALCKWADQGWLVPYDEEVHGKVKGTIPLMAVIQRVKRKVRPVMDFREVNCYLDPHTADTDVCGEKIREWRRCGRDVALLDLRDAYLQIHVHPSLWPYQTVVWQGRRWCLTRLAFGMSVSPLIMKKVLGMALSWDKKIDSATSPYIDDILVREDIVSAGEVKTHLEKHGLVCKPVERIADGARVLGLRVWGERPGLFWRREISDIELPPKLTRRAVFSICGRLTSHLPVCGWLRVAASYLKRRANAATTSWDDEVTDPELCAIVSETLQRVKASDPARGRWDVTGSEATVWVDASSIALGAVLEVSGEVIEDVSWLRKSTDSHINLAELDAVVRGVNLAVAWKMKQITLVTDSRTVYHWLSDALSGKARLKTKAASELLIRRRLETIKNIVTEYDLDVQVKSVPSAENKADFLTRVPKKWLSTSRGVDKEVCAGAVMEADIAAVHETSGHPGIRRTLHLCRRLDPSVTRKKVQQVVRQCSACQSIDPAPQRWQHGTLSVEKNWERVSMDICHVDGDHYLTLVDCGPSRYTIWRQLRRQDTASVIAQLEAVFLERCAPRELLTDNYLSFRSVTFLEFISRWGATVRYRAAYAPSGNGISERNHRSIKTIAARKGCTVAEAVYRYNTMPRSDAPGSSPADTLFNYASRVHDVDPEVKSSEEQYQYSVGDQVWVRDPSRRCDVPSSLGTVSRVVSSQNVEVDGVSRHVRDLRLALLPRSDVTPPQGPGSVGEQRVPVSTEDSADDDAQIDGHTVEAPILRRSTRARVPATMTQYGDL